MLAFPQAILMKLRLTSMTAGLAVGITAAVALACATGAYFYSVHHFQTLLDNERRTALAQGELMRVALEHQMIENDRTLIAAMIRSFGQEPGVANVVLLDRTGDGARPRARRSGPPRISRSPRRRARRAIGCQPTQRGSSRVIDTRGGTMLRTVIPFRNREACYGCHDPAHRINGIMILDLDAGGMRDAMNDDLRWMVLGSGGLALLLIAAIAIMVRLFLLRRLQRFETTARLIAKGDLERRVPADGSSDTISWLASEFNTMADSMSGMVGEIRSQRERLETVINSIDDGIVVLDATPESHRRQRRVSAAIGNRPRAGARLLLQGCGAGTLHGQRLSDHGLRAYRRAAGAHLRAAHRRRRSALGGGARVANPRAATGSLVQVVEVWRDITERRASEARLAESHRMASLGMLASGFSHELNTPLATVLMCLEGILRDGSRRDEPDWPRVHESASDRARADPPLPRNHPAVPPDVARPVVRRRCRRAPGHRAGGGAAGRAHRPRTRHDASRLTPAARARARSRRRVRTPARADQPVAERRTGVRRRRIAVTLSLVAGDPVRLRIADNGCGIGVEHQQRIFEPFFSMRRGGTGLGLFLSLTFVRRWGGDIVVSSAPGRDRRSISSCRPSKRTQGSGVRTQGSSEQGPVNEAAYRPAS